MSTGTAAKPTKAPFPAFGKASARALAYALDLIRRGILSIDDEGRVWRLAKITHAGLKQISARRAESPTRKGYLAVVLTDTARPGKTAKVFAHILVWTYLHGPVPSGMQVNHIDLNKSNNRPENLELLTGAGNIQHSYANGRPRPWHKATTWQSKPRITEEQKQEIRRLRAAGKQLKEIGAQFNLGTSHVCRICTVTATTGA